MHIALWYLGTGLASALMEALGYRIRKRQGRDPRKLTIRFYVVTTLLWPVELIGLSLALLGYRSTIRWFASLAGIHKILPDTPHCPCGYSLCPCGECHHCSGFNS
jgi:membrane protein required for beta-lactamase induction